MVVIVQELGLSVKPYYKQDGITIYCGDCREILPQLDVKVDLVLTDPPYGVTKNKQDIPVDLSCLFEVSAGVILFAQQPFTTDVITQFRKSFRYDLVWDKVLTTGFLNANKMPLRRHESILVFGDVKYFPQKTVGAKNHSRGRPKPFKNNNYGMFDFVDNSDELGNLKHPTSILTYAKPHPSVSLHRTEKPLDLMQWLLSSYSAADNLILEPFLGSGTIALAAKIIGRKCIGIDISEDCCEIAAKRCSQAMQLTLAQLNLSNSPAVVAPSTAT
jgi:site-specific DNA-methyltransferase (adenine-specific)